MQSNSLDYNTFLLEKGFLNPDGKHIGQKFI